DLPPAASRADAGAAPVAVSAGVPIKTCAAKSGKVVVLTFDDGPSPYTDRLLAILKEKRAPAAFFLKGKKLDPTFQGYEEHRRRVQRIHEAGHEICNHTFTHRGLVGQTADKMREDIVKPEALIAGITGRRTKCLRPPYGDRNEEVLRLLGELDYLVILWSLNTEDWRYASTDRLKELDPGKMLELIQKTTGRVPGPHIHIQHDSEYSEPSVEAVPGIIDALRGQGYKTISLSECIGAPIDGPWKG
ncbi:MAG TPA: polysaccharide deacetylase family protein, partial [Candidatus Nanopelagicales bacterium]|nr:polysaccharide deacetylase family protein [Candidatus Nanopelagicales bacterium]